jgi:acyl-coenzyme A thioesterase PaaI-like protein
MLCNWRPEPFHIGHPGYVYGGTIASVVDCHSIWTALADYCRETGHALDDGPPPFAFVTGSLKVDYLKPVPIEGEMELRARVLEKGERKTIIGCRVLHSGIECAVASAVAVRVRLEA